MERGLSRKEFLRVGGAASAALVAGSALGVGRAAPGPTEAYSVASPDGSVEVVFGVERGRPAYSVGYAGRVVVEESGMGFRLKGAKPLDGGFEVLGVEEDGFDESWRPVWGASSEIRNRYNELSVRLRESGGPRRRLDVVFRVFDDGVGFRYAFPEQENLGDFVISEEDTEFRFAGDHTAWSIPANYDSYEYLYAETTLSNIGTLAEGDEPRTAGQPFEIENFGSAATPLTVEIADDLYVAVHEAALYDYAGMTLAKAEGGPPHALRSALVPLKGGDGEKVRTSAPRSTPWRTLTIGRRAGDLIESNLILNLNEPCVIRDTSWIRPGKYVGIWWEIHKGESTWAPGPDLGATTENAKRYIDFAAAHGIPYLLAEGWNVGWQEEDFGTSQDFLTPNDDFDLREVVEYGHERGVGFLGHNETGGGVENYERQIDEAFAKYEELGMPGVKTGYAGKIPDYYHHDQRMVNHYQRVIEKAAEHRLMIDAHEPIKPTGIERTYPNFVTREGVQGQEFSAWSAGNPPEHTVTIPFTRMLAGPVDYTPGIFNIQWVPRQAEDDSFGYANDGTRVHTTRAHQIALYPVLLSGLQMLADVPEHYEGEPELEFLERVPVTWDETRVLSGEVGDHITVARRAGEEWYVGSLTDEVAREVVVPLGFLGGGRYVAHVYADAPDADYETNPNAVEIGRYLVGSSDEIVASMARGGGQAIRLSPATARDIESLPAYGTSLPETGGVELG